MPSLYDCDAPKKPTHLSINSDLLKKSRELDINLSSGVEEALEQLIKRKLSERWIAENRDAIANYNEYVDDNGVFSSSPEFPSRIWASLSAIWRGITATLWRHLIF